MQLAAAALDATYLMRIMPRLGYEFEATFPKVEIAVTKGEGKGEAARLFQEHMDYFYHGPIEVGPDSKAAYDLCHREGPGSHSHHVERKYFKLREMRGAKIVDVIKVGTMENEADIFTKPLDRRRATFERHRDTIMNRHAGGA